MTDVIKMTGERDNREKKEESSSVKGKDEERDETRNVRFNKGYSEGEKNSGTKSKYFP